jgi:hypothetical protein
MSKQNKNITVAISSDEWYPVYNLSKIKKGEKPSVKLKVPKNLFDEYQSATNLFDKLHVKIRELVEQQKLNP